MKSHELQVSSHKAKKRVGRGIAAGQGKTAGRGTKGQNSRTGKKFGSTFMGGQGPLMRRVPKLRGFKSIRVPAQVVYTDLLSEVKGAVTNQSLFEAGLIATPFHSVKIIFRGDVTAKADVKVQSASKNAIEAITKAGGSFEKTDVPHLPASQRTKKTDAADKPEKAEK
jgi:large subunit ribosomal protein L15